MSKELKATRWTARLSPAVTVPIVPFSHAFCGRAQQTTERTAPPLMGGFGCWIAGRFR